MEPDAEQAIANILSSATAAIQCVDVLDCLISISVRLLLASCVVSCISRDQLLQVFNTAP